MESKMRVLSFTMHGRCAHFCAPYTNVNRLTQPCPTKTAIMGFVGAVLGIDKDDLSLYQQIQCGVEISATYRTISMPYLTRQGFPGTTANKKSSQTSLEVVISPRYKVYLAGEDKLLSKVRELMLCQEPVFTPYLGLAQFIASTDFMVSKIIDAELTDSLDITVNGIFIRGYHGELDFDKINKLPNKNKLRITEFEGLAGIKPPRDFEHAVFTANLDGGSVPIKDAKNVLKITNWNKNVPIF